MKPSDIHKDFETFDANLINLADGEVLMQAVMLLLASEIASRGNNRWLVRVLEELKKREEYFDWWWEYCERKRKERKTQ